MLPKPNFSNLIEDVQPLAPLRCQLSTLEVLAHCVRMNWMAIVVSVVEIPESM